MTDDDWDDPYNFSCHSVGMGGGCGEDCPVFIRGDCENADDMVITVDITVTRQDKFRNFDDAMEILK